MKTSPFTKAAISSLLALSLSSVQADETNLEDSISSNLSGYIGQKTLDDTDWQPLDKQGAIGVIFDIKKESWPVSIAFDLIGSGDVHESGSFKDEAYTLENHLGVRKIFQLPDSSVQPYIGGGISMVSAEIKNKNNGIITSESDDNATGAWIGTGMYYAVSNHFNIGLDVRYSEADVKLFNTDRKVGGMHTGISVGYHW